MTQIVWTCAGCGAIEHVQRVEDRSTREHTPRKWRYCLAYPQPVCPTCASSLPSDLLEPVRLRR